MPGSKAAQRVAQAQAANSEKEPGKTAGKKKKTPSLREQVDSLLSTQAEMQGQMIRLAKREEGLINRLSSELKLLRKTELKLQQSWRSEDEYINKIVELEAIINQQNQEIQKYAKKA